MFKMVILPDQKGEKMVVIKFIKHHPFYSKGTELHCGMIRAKKYIRSGFAEYKE